MMTVMEFRRFSTAEQACLRLERYCDGNWAARYTGLRELLTVAQAMKLRRLCDGDPGRDQ